MTHRTTLITRRRWIAGDIALIVIAAAWFGHGWWLSLLPAWADRLLGLTQVWDNAILDQASLPAILGFIITGLAAWLGLRTQAHDATQQETRPALPLRQATLDAKLAGGVSIQRADRNTTAVGDLLRHPHLISGSSRSGKPREALKLIRLPWTTVRLSRRAWPRPPFKILHQKMRPATGLLVALACISLLIGGCGGPATVIPTRSALVALDPTVAHTATAVPARSTATQWVPTAESLSPTPKPTRAPPTAAPTVAPTSSPAPSVAQPARVNGQLKVHFIDVGQGDSALIQTPDGHNVLIDAGESGSGALAYLKSQGVQTLDLVVVSHPHSDHIGGLPEVIRALPVAQVAASGQPHTTNAYSRLLDAIMAAKAKYTEVKRGDKLSVGNFTFDVLSPAKIQPTGDLNNNSVVLRLTYGQTSFLFEGDAQADAEASMLAAGVVTQMTVLKVAHHGSRAASTPAFLSVVRPQIAVYSAGTGNAYGHPHAQTIAALQAVGAKIYGTDKEGTVVVTSDGQAVKMGGGEIVAPRAPPPAPVQIQPTQPSQPQPTKPQTPTVAPSSASATTGLILKIVSITSPARPGGKATVAAQAVPGAECGTMVYYKSGPSKAAGLGDITAASNGTCSWTWNVGANTTPGTWRIVVRATVGG